MREATWSPPWWAWVLIIVGAAVQGSMALGFVLSPLAAQQRASVSNTRPAATGSAKPSDKYLGVSSEEALEREAAELQRKRAEANNKAAEAERLARQKELEGTIGDGMHMVGKDVQPGRYRVEAAGSCYYARLRDFGGDIHDIIANHNVREGETAIVTIKASDKGFESKRCGRWYPVE